MGAGGVDSGTESLFLPLVDSMPIPLALASFPDLVLVFLNPAALALAGALAGKKVELADLLGRPVLEGLPFMDGKGLMEFFSSVGNSGVAGSIGPVEFHLPGGETRCLNLQVYPLTTKDDHVTHVAGTAFDVTAEVLADRERLAALTREKAAREEAERQSAEIRALLASLSEGVTIRDGEGRLVWRNEKAAEITGVPYGDSTLYSKLREERFSEVDGSPVPPERRPFDALQRGEDLVDRELFYHRPSGERRRLTFHGASIKDGQGKVHLTVATFHDVTELRQLEAAKDQFMQVIAHELRNPLAAAMGLIQLVARGSDIGDIPRRRLEQGMTELKKMGALIDDILTGYRVSSGRLPLQLSKMNFVDAVRESVDSFLSGGATDHRIAAVYSDRRTIPVDGDSRRLMQVITNLLSNAAKYSPPNTTISLTVDPRADHVILKVEDQGIGIPPGELEAVFQGFYRATNLSDRQGGGVGLGLYISRDIARRHGGNLWAENRPAGGTSMKLKLPLVKNGPVT